MFLEKITELINNKKNKGTFMSRNLGAFFSKEKINFNFDGFFSGIIIYHNFKNSNYFIKLFHKLHYIIIPDQDDIISKNILKICYKNAEKYNLEIIRFIDIMEKIGFKFPI